MVPLTGEIENIIELWDFVHEKGKKLLAEKQAEAEAYKAEKDAVWRRIEDNSTRVAALEKSAKARSLAHAAGEGNDLFGFASPEGSSLKDDVLELKVAMMKDQFEAAKLELRASRKAQLYYKRASLQSCGRSSRSPSPTSSPNKLLEHGSAPSSSDGAPGGVVKLPRVGVMLMPPRTAGGSMKVLPHARPTAEDDGHGVDSISPEDKEDLKGFEDEIEDPQRKDMANDLDASRLLEQNASLMAELDSKNELFEALRQQLKQLQYMTQQRGTRGRCTFSPRHAIEELGEAGSDDDCGDENENPDFGVRERSLMDDLLADAGGRPKEETWGAGRIEPVAPERRRFFGGVVRENIPSEIDKIADWDSPRAQQGNILPKADREKFPSRGKKCFSTSPPRRRRRRRSLDRAGGRGPSPVSSSRHEAGSVSGLAGQSLTVAAAPTSTPMLATTAGALETWPGSPRGVPLSCCDARVGEQQQQSNSEVEMAELDVTELDVTELDVAVGRQQAPISLGSMKKENVAMTKREVEETQVPVIGGENSPTSVVPSAERNESIFRKSAWPEAATIGEKGVEDVQSPSTTFEQSAKLGATENTVMDAQAKALENHLYSAKAVEGDDFPASEKHASTSPNILEGDQAFDVEEDMTTLKKGGELPLEEGRNVQEPAVEGGSFFSANDQEPTSFETGKPKVVMKVEMGDSQSPPAGGGPRGVTRNRAERKSRQVMAKLGLRAVSGVSHVTMKASNGDIFIVENPDVFKHPRQSTYVIFGEANSEKSGSVGRGRHPTARRAGAVAFLNPAPANCAPREVERSLMDDLLADAGGRPKEETWGAGRIEPVAPERRRFFGGVVRENIPSEIDKIADWDSPRAQQGNIPPKADREKFPSRGKKYFSTSPPRRCRRRSLDRAGGRGPSPVSSSRHEAGSVSGLAGQSLTVAAAPTLTPMLATTAGALETWPGSPRGVPLSCCDARVGEQQQQSNSEVEMAELEVTELDVAVGRQQAPISLGSMKKENVAMTKREVEETQVPVIVGEKSPTSVVPSAERNESIFRKSAWPEAASIGEKGVEGVQSPSTTFEQSAKLEATENTVMDAQAKAPENHLYSAKAVEGDDFPASEKHASTSPDILEGDQAFDVEEDMTTLKKGGELPLEEGRNVQEPAVEGGSFFSANDQEPTSFETGKPKVVMKVEMGDSQSPPAGGGPRGVTRNRAERKSRQVMAKLGLRAVSGVSHVTMKASNGDIFIVENPDVFKHPRQSTYVNFGEANSEKSGSVGRGRHPTARRAGAEAFLNPAPANCAPREVERSLMDDLLADAGGRPKEETWGAGRIEPVAPERRCSFGGAVQENIPSEIDKIADWGSSRAQQGNIPPKADREKFPSRGKKYSSTSPPRRRRSLDRAGGRGPSPVASSRHEAGSVSGLAGQSLTVAAAPTLTPMLATTAGALETWPGSPRGVPPSCCDARVGEQQQQSNSEVEMAELDVTELDVAVGRQQAPISLGSMKKENVAMTKREVEETQVPVIVGEKSPTSVVPSAERNESIFRKSAWPEAATIGEKGVEDVQSPSTTFEQSAKLEATENTVMDAQAKAPENHLYSAKAVEGDDFPASEKHASTSPDILEGDQAFDVEEDMTTLKKGGELPLEEGRNVQEPAVEGGSFFSANDQEPTSFETGKPKVVMKVEMGDSQSPPAGGGPRGVTRNRAERKSRQVMAKLGLRAVSGVSHVTMKASNGDIFIVENPDVFKHPRQSTYVIFGEANSEKSGSVGRGRHPTARRAGAEAFLNPAPANCAPREVERSLMDDLLADAGGNPALVMPPPFIDAPGTDDGDNPKEETWGAGRIEPVAPERRVSNVDRATVDDRSASAGTLMFHPGCVRDAAIRGYGRGRWRRGKRRHVPDGA